ncbi:MAG TPA: hypothetical protein VN512_13165 [Clostridia bacterium]|nr:hypothetical protein [Clostridia bacterium]
MKTWTEKDFNLKDDTNETKKMLAAQPKVTIVVPSEDKFWEGMINGYGLMIRTNVPVEVPQDVARLIGNNARVLRQSEKALEPFRKASGKKLAEM